ncbi:MAG: bifunctional diaminohydroxyphosphoribosylaminopyrimidine deaminase/5-amino-6-(5-phosphoribosylamino)uracil reductase RibD [Ignavibacteriales bacterium]|nr:bifunctional diaminohydroxyphosphoribosylaminopyrimidine deaminase/5-amino-6-(5-phosphoribosylamino)uracil reductase RibD [Ignavibacteriales bacterium]
MSQCLTLAEQGAGNVSPNPMVGAIIIKDGKIIYRGYHKRFGDSHAEVNAIRSVKSSVRGATLYVNLEPCSYYGKTPPCTDLIISSGISKVIIGMIDPNPLVSGKGIAQLKRAGIKVLVGISEDDCRKLNEAFIKYITKGVPFVTLKIAQTIDGKIADTSERSKWISNPLSRKIVHELRSRVDAVIVGADTINKDNPQLTTHGLNRRNPLRVILDGGFRVNLNSKIFSQRKKGKTLIFISERSSQRKEQKKKILISKGVEVVEVKSRGDHMISIDTILKILGLKGISSVLVEGGSSVFSAFLQSNMVDKLLVFIAPKILGQGLSPFEQLTNRNITKCVQLNNVVATLLDGDVLLEGYFKK